MRDSLFHLQHRLESAENSLHKSEMASKAHLQLIEQYRHQESVQKAQIQSLQRDYSMLERRLQEHEKAEKSTVEGILEPMQKKCDSQSELIAQLERDLLDSRKRIASKASEVNSLYQRLTEAHRGEKLFGTGTGINALTNEMQELRASNASKSSEIAVLYSEIAALNRKNHEFQCYLESRQASNGELQRERISSEVKTLQETILVQRSRIEALEEIQKQLIKEREWEKTKRNESQTKESKQHREIADIQAKLAATLPVSVASQSSHPHSFHPSPFAASYSPFSVHPSAAPSAPSVSSICSNSDCELLRQRYQQLENNYELRDIERKQLEKRLKSLELQWQQRESVESQSNRWISEEKNGYLEQLEDQQRKIAAFMEENDQVRGEVEKWRNRAERMEEIVEKMRGMEGFQRWAALVVMSQALLKELRGFQQLFDAISLGVEPELGLVAGAMGLEELMAHMNKKMKSALDEAEALANRGDGSEWLDWRANELSRSEEELRECFGVLIGCREKLMAEYTRRVVENQCAMQ